MYSVVDRNTNTTIISNEEIFAVQGMANTYTFGVAPILLRWNIKRMWI